MSAARLCRRWSNVLKLGTPVALDAQSVVGGTDDGLIPDALTRRLTLWFMVSVLLLGPLSGCTKAPVDRLTFIRQDDSRNGPGVGIPAPPSDPGRAPRPPYRRVTVSVGPQETILAAPGANLPDVPPKPYAWPDGTMGILKSGATYTFFAANDGNLRRCIGTLENPGRCGGSASIRIRNLQANLNYAGGGPVYRDPATGTLLMFYHGERYKDGTDWLVFHSSLGLAKSSDGGATWVDLGEILTPNITPETVFAGKSPWDVGGGAHLIIGDHFHVYFRDRMLAGGTAELAVARARVADVVEAAIVRDTAAPWRKYHNGTWDEAGLGGRSSPLEAANALSAWLAVSYNTYLGRYVMVAFGRPWPATNLYWLESVDGLTWTDRKLLVDDAHQKVYVTLAGLGDDPRVTDQSFYVYYVSSAKAATGGNRNLDGVLARRLITLFVGPASRSGETE
jgi:hypothetical protein